VPYVLIADEALADGSGGRARLAEASHLAAVSEHGGLISLVGTVVDRMVDRWDSVASPAWLSRLEDEVAAEGLGGPWNRCYLGNCHLRRRIAKWMAGDAVMCAMSQFSRAIWFTCMDGLVASTGRGRVRTSFRWGDVRTHRIQTVLRLIGQTLWMTDEWWLTLANGSSEHLLLHSGSALHPDLDADVLTTSLASGVARAHTSNTRAVLTSGEPVAFGRVTASRLGIEIDGVTVGWCRLSSGLGGHGGRRRLGGRWTPFSPRRWRAARSVLFVERPGGGPPLVVPTREVDNLFVLRELRLDPPQADGRSAEDS